MIGDDAAPTFFEVTEAGSIKVKTGSNLATDKETDYTVRTDHVSYRSCQMICFGFTSNVSDCDSMQNGMLALSLVLCSTKHILTAFEVHNWYQKSQILGFNIV